MFALARGVIAAALVVLLSIPTPTIAADKPFKRDDLADAAIKLEAQIKSEAGQVTKTTVALRREADAAFQRNDFRTGMQILGQIVVVAPDDSANWLRLAKSVLLIRASSDRERTLSLDRRSSIFIRFEPRFVNKQSAVNQRAISCFGHIRAASCGKRRSGKRSRFAAGSTVAAITAGWCSSTCAIVTARCRSCSTRSSARTRTASPAAFAMKTCCASRAWSGRVLKAP